MLKIGSHVSMNGKEMFLGSVKEAASYGANTFMIYTGAPQNTRRKNIEDLNIGAGQSYMKERGMDGFIVHAPYIINLGNTIKSETYRLAVDFLKLELERTNALGSTTLVLHPGAHVGAGSQAGLKQIINGLNEVLRKDTPVNIALETMAGKGTELGRTFEELAVIYDGVVHNDKLRICFDTCHVNDSGYDIKHNFDKIITEFDHIIGIDQICTFHINDSKNPMGAHKDRHENIGFGTIGFEALSYIVHHPAFKEVPKILETPYIPAAMDSKDSYAPYKQEIEMLKERKFHPDLKNEIIDSAGL